MIKVRLKPKQGIKVGLKTVYLYDETLIADQVNKAKEWAIKTDGKVQEEGVDVDYSSKHYAGLSKESENNAKQSELKATQEANASAESAYQSQQSALASYEYASNADADADNAAESATIAYNSEQNAIAQANKATEEANAAAESAYQAQTSALAAHEYASNAEADAQNALETLGHVLESETISTNAANTATQKAQEALESAEEAQRIKDSIGSVYFFKGSVNTIADLPSDAKIGDVYDVLDSGTNYAWTGDRWDSLGASFDLSEYAKKEYVDTTEQEIIKNFMEADTDLQTQITGLSGVLDSEQNKIMAIEGKIPTNASTSNMLSTASDLLNATQDVRSDLAEADSELQTQINGQATAISDLSDDVMANMGEIADIKERIKNVGGGLEIGDIGIAPLGIDETKNLRRYLNGQVISQTQFEAFTNLIKKRILTNPSIATTEENWQSEVSLSKLGQCGKFVIDDTLGTIRLPKVVNINGLQDLDLLGNIKNESLPNITGTTYYVLSAQGAGLTSSGVFKSTNLSTTVDMGASSSKRANSIEFNASFFSSTYQDNAPVQQEAVQYPYFIQVATGNEEQADITTEIQLNNPFSLLDYKWSEYELTNASWLLSNGAFHSGATYPAVYELLLKIYNGTETKQGVSVKLNTETYEDTDFVLNTAESTFRLPIKVKLASGKAVVGNGMILGLTDGTENGGLQLTQYTNLADHKAANVVPEYYGTPVGTTFSTRTDFSKNHTGVGVTTDPTKSGIETSSQDLYLYFYVGETVQDANVIATSQVLTKVANSIDRTLLTDRETVVGWGMPSDTYVDLTLEASDSEYTAPANGFVFIRKKASAAGQYLCLRGSSNVGFQEWSSSNSATGSFHMTIPVRKGETFKVTYNMGGSTEIFRFVYAEGEI